MMHGFRKWAAVAATTGALAVGMSALFSGAALAGGGAGGAGGGAAARCFVPIGVSAGVLIGQGGDVNQCNAVGGGGGNGG